MCPDNEILSAFIDSELEKNWHSTVEEHLNGCSSCLETEGKLRQVKNFLHSADAEVRTAGDDAMMHVWRGIMRSRDRRPYFSVPFRRLRLSFTALAMLGLVCAGLGAVGMFYATHGISGTEAAVAAIETRDGFGSVEELLSYLEANDKVVSFTIELPEEPVFLVLGEPQLLLPAEYRRGQ